MWKDLFYFSKGQRIAIILLIVLIITIIAINAFMPKFFPSETNPFDKDITLQVENFKRSLLSLDSIRNAERQAAYEKKYNEEYAPQKNEKAYSLFNFDPNTADSSTLAKLGLKPYIISNILKYREKGAFFKTKDSFSKVYGISEQKFKELMPYIKIAEVHEKKSDSIVSVKIVEANIENTIVELNSADTTTLMKLKGIGSYYAKGIVIFRNKLGGFVSVEQLREVYGMKDEVYQTIRNSFTINQNLVRKIDVNTASVNRLKSHPYLNFYQAKEIYEYRRKKGKLTNIDELNVLENLNAQSIKKIEPYLEFK